MNDSRLHRARSLLADALETRADDETYFYALVTEAKDELTNILED